MLAFLLTPWSFHQQLPRSRNAPLREADLRSPHIADIQRRLAGGEDESGPAAVRQALDDMTARYRAIEAPPTWPLARRTRRALGLDKLVVLLPMFAEFTGLSADVARFLGIVVTAGAG